MKKIVVLMVLFVTVVLSGCKSENEDLNSLEKVLDKGYIILGLDDTFAPMGYRDEEGEVVGFDIDLAKAVANELGVELRIQPIEWDSKLIELNSKNIDMIWNGLTITEERSKQINFSDAYLNNRQIVITNESNTIDSLDALEGLKIGVQIDSSGQTALESSSIYSKVQEVVKFNTFNDALMDLNSGRIDAIVIDEIMARYVATTVSYSLVVTDVSLGDEEYGIGFRLEENELRAKVDEILDMLSETGKTAEISIKWFGEDIFKD